MFIILSSLLHNWTLPVYLYTLKSHPSCFYSLNYFNLLITDMLFHKVDLKEAIRYASGDPLESWLNGFLCLDFVNYLPPINRLLSLLLSSFSKAGIRFSLWNVVNVHAFCCVARFPHPSECCLYYVNRDTLFSFHKESEVFLQVYRVHVMFWVFFT